MQTNKTMLILATMVMGCVLLVGSQAQAATYWWTNANGNNNWDEAGNYEEYDSDSASFTTATTVPGIDGPHDRVYINRGGDNSLDLDNPDSYPGELDDGTMQRWKYLNGGSTDPVHPDREDSVLNLSAGKLQVWDDTTTLGYGGYTDTINQTGGEYNQDSGEGLTLGVEADSTGRYEISGGVFHVSQVYMDGDGTGEFTVNGSQPDITVGGDGDSFTGARWHQGDGTLRSLIDENGVSTIKVQEGEDGWKSSGEVTFDAGATLDMGFLDGASASAGDTFELLTWVRDRTSGLDNLSLAPEDEDSWNIIWNEGANGSLTAEYIPEPSSLLLLGLAGLLLMKRRRV